jgi:hypothetical protein
MLHGLAGQASEATLAARASGYHVAFAAAAIMLGAGAVILGAGLRQRHLQRLEVDLTPSSVAA